MKNLKNLGKALNKAEQKSVFGGGRNFFTHDCGPYDEYCCNSTIDCQYLYDSPDYICQNGTCVSG